MTFNDNVHSGFTASFGNNQFGKVLFHGEDSQKYHNEVNAEIFRAASTIHTDFIYTAVINQHGEYFINWISAEFKNFTGFTPVNFIGSKLGWFELVTEHSRETYFSLFNNFSAITAGNLSAEYKMRVNSGDEIWVKDTVRKVRSIKEPGNEFIVGAVKSIQQEKLIEQAYQQSENKFLQLFENAQIPIIYYSEDKRILFINRVAAAGFHDDPVNLFGKSIYELYPETKAKILNEIIEAVINNKTTVQSEETCDPEGGKWYNASYQPVYDNNRKVIAVQKILIDITRRKKNESKMLLHNETLQRSNYNKDRLFSIIAHDLKNPFISLLGFSEYLSTEISTLTPAEIAEYADNINTSAKNIFSLLENLLQWSRLQTGQIEPSTSKFELNHLLENVIYLYKNAAEQKKIKINTALHTTPLYVNADSNMVETVLRNLISNAVKFSGENSEINIVSKDLDRKFEICVCDNGIGMDSETLNNIFRPGEFSSRSGTANEKGTGLGLLLCREFIEINNGVLRVESIEGEGSRFYFTLDPAGH